MKFEEIYQQGEQLYQQGKIQKAVSFLEKSLREKLQRDAKIEILYLLSKCQTGLSQGDKARSSIEHGLELADKLGKKDLQQKGNLYLEKLSGEMAIQGGDHESGASAYHRAREIAVQINLWEEEVDLLLRESKAYFYMGDDFQAKEMLDQAKQKAEKHKNRGCLPTLLGDLGDIALRNGESEKAHDYYRSALKKAKKNQDNLGVLESYSRLGKWNFYRGHSEKALDLLNRALELSKGNPLGQIDIWGTLGKIHFFIGDNESAQKSYQKALGQARKIGDSLGELNNLGNLGNVSLRLGQMDEARDHFKSALKIARNIHDAQGEMNTLGWLGDVFYQKGENIKALNHYYKALERAHRLGSPLGESSNLSRIGDIFFSRYENDTAFQKYSEALELARQANSPPAILNNLISLGDIYFRKGEDDQALKHYEEGLEIAFHLNSPQGMLNAIQSLGDVYFRRGREDEALHRFRQSLGLSRKLEDPVAEILSLRGIGDVFFRQGDYKKAQGHHKKALEMALQIDDSLEVLIQKTKIGEIYLKRGRRELAQKYFGEAYELARKYDSPEGLLTTLTALGNFDIEQGMIEEGEKKFKEAVPLAEKLDKPLEKIKILSVLGWIEIQQGKFPQALKTYEQTVELLHPIASGDIEEEMVAPPTLSRKERLEKLKKRVAQAANQVSIEGPSTPVEPPVVTEEDTGEFQAIQDPGSAMALGKLKNEEEFLPDLSREEGRQIYRKGWKNLEVSLFSSDLSEVLHTVIALRKIGERQVLPLLERAYGVYDGKMDILNQIIKALEEIPGRESGPTLSRLFREEKKVELKIPLAEVLASQGHLGGVDYLLTLSQKKNPFQNRAIESLGNCGQKEVMASLQEILETSKEARLSTTTLTALMALGDPLAEQKLMDSVNSDDLTNMFVTAKALARVGKESAIRSLEIISETIIDKGKPSLEEFSILQRSIEERLSFQGEVFPLLQKAFSFKPLRASLFLLLDGHSAPFLEKELQTSISSQERWEIRAGAAHALGYLLPNPLAPLQKTFYSDSSPAVRVSAGGALMRIFKREGLVDGR